MSEKEGVEYVEVAIDEFQQGKDIPFDIFIRLSERKYVKLANKGDDLTPERLAGYKAKKITALWLRKEDFLKYVGLKVTELPHELKEEKEVGELCKLGDLTLEIVFFNEMNEIVFGTAKNFVDTTIALITDNRHAMGLLAPLNASGNFIYAHGVAVSTYSVMIARQMGWTSAAAIFKVALGGLLHDIGKKDFKREMLLKPTEKLTADEALQLRQHPVLGVKALEQVPSVPTDIVEIVLQHHETVKGTGYPAGLNRPRIHPMAKIVAVGNGFCNLVLRGPDGPGMKPQDAIASLEASGEYDAEPLTALKRVFKVK